MKELITTRRLFLKRSGAAFGVVAFLPMLTRASTHFRPTSHGHYYEHTILAMGTTARLGVYASNERAANSAISKAFDELKRLEALFSVFDPSSELSHINREAGDHAVEVSNEMLEIVIQSLAFSEVSGGAFDITVEPLMELWGFRNASNVLNQLPTLEEVQSALKFVGPQMIEIDAKGKTIALRSKGAKLDLGGVAVGFALDRMETILRNEGIEHAFLDISGDIIALGTPEHEPKGWRVAVPDPSENGKLIYETRLSNNALATSGNYESYVVYQAMKFGHIMDPKEGHSAHRVLSTTAISRRGITVDGLSTASFVTGAKLGQQCEFVIVDQAGSVRTV
jgi:thiamine biosynthesis lipoprotein